MVATLRLWVLGTGCVLALAGCASAREDGAKGKPVPAREVVSGGARLRGGGLRMDAVVGRAFVQRAATGGARGRAITAKPAAAVTP